MEEQNQKVGWIGLWLAIGGMVLPILIAILCYMVFEEDVTSLCALLFLACEVAALGCGIASRKSGPGRAALIVSAVSLVLSVLLFMSFSLRMVESTPSQEPELSHLGVPGWLNQGDSTGALKMWRFSILTPVMFRLRIHRDGAVIHEVSVGEAMKGRCADLLRDRGREALDSPRATVSGQGVLFFRQEHIPTVGISSRDLTDGTDPPSFAKLSLSGSGRMDNTGTGSMEASMHEDVTTKPSDFLTVAELEQSVKGQLVFRGTGGGGGTVKLDHNSLQKPLNSFRSRELTRRRCPSLARCSS